MGIPTNTMATKGVKNGAPSSNAAKYDLPSHFIGGNHLGVAPSSKVKDFVAAHGGHTVITNVSFKITWQTPDSS
jgi:acetyl-CoA carboxylase/biotin carboxylase 1